MPIQFSLSNKRIVAPVAALALMIAVGLPAHAGGGTTTSVSTACSTASTPSILTLAQLFPTLSQLISTPVSCDPAPVKCDPAPFSFLPTPVACLPTPVACLPTPVACLPTPVACLPTPVACLPTPISCVPTPVQCSPAPQCAPTAAVPEPASVALVGVGMVALLPLGMRAMRSRRIAG